MSTAIAAAGGIVWRASRGGVRVAVIHRPHRHDWSLPKGKLLSRESSIVAAHREVVEETGLEVSLQCRVGRVRYRVGTTPKTVVYWAMRYQGGSFVPNAEADELRWLSPDEAGELLTFEADRSMIDVFTAQPRVDSIVLLVRHAKAGKRNTWKKDDRLRPIDAFGRRQAAAVATVGALFAPQRVLAAPLTRCEQTVAPLAATLGLPVASGAKFADAQFERNAERSTQALEALARAHRVTVVASQGIAIPGLLDFERPDRAPHDSRKGSIWALCYSDGRLVAMDYYERPGCA